MVLSDYRIDPQTGAVIFRKNERKHKMREMQEEIDDLKKRVDELEKALQLTTQKAGDE